MIGHSIFFPFYECSEPFPSATNSASTRTSSAPGRYMSPNSALSREQWARSGPNASNSSISGPRRSHCRRCATSRSIVRIRPCSRKSRLSRPKVIPQLCRMQDLICASVWGERRKQEEDTELTLPQKIAAQNNWRKPRHPEATAAQTQRVQQ